MSINLRLLFAEGAAGDSGPGPPAGASTILSRHAKTNLGGIPIQCIHLILALRLFEW